MSIHSSLRGVDTLVGSRSVLSRVERIQKLVEKGEFDEEKDSVYGLPKVRTKFKTVSGKKAKALAAERDAATGGGEGAEGEAGGDEAAASE